MLPLSLASIATNGLSLASTSARREKLGSSAAYMLRGWVLGFLWLLGRKLVELLPGWD